MAVYHPDLCSSWRQARHAIRGTNRQGHCRVEVQLSPVYSGGPGGPCQRLPTRTRSEVEPGGPRDPQGRSSVDPRRTRGAQGPPCRGTERSRFLLSTKCECCVVFRLVATSAGNRWLPHLDATVDDQECVCCCGLGRLNEQRLNDQQRPGETARR